MDSNLKIQAVIFKVFAFLCVLKNRQKLIVAHYFLENPLDNVTLGVKSR